MPDSPHSPTLDFFNNPYCSERKTILSEFFISARSVSMLIQNKSTSDAYIKSEVGMTKPIYTEKINTAVKEAFRALPKRKRIHEHP